MLQQLLTKARRMLRAPFPDPISDAIEARKNQVGERAGRELRRACEENQRVTSEFVDAAREAARAFQGKPNGAY
jgi:hypothetical protein